MPQCVAAVALLVRDYDEARTYYQQILGFELIEDTPLDGDKRWVVVAPRGSQCRLLLALAATPEQSARVGDQTGRAGVPVPAH